MTFVYVDLFADPLSRALSLAADEPGDRRDAVADGPGLDTARDRVQEVVTRFIDQRWAQISMLEGIEDDAQIDKWLLDAVAHDMHEMAKGISPTRARRLPPFRHRKR